MEKPTKRTSLGNNDGMSFAVKIKNLEFNNYYQLSFGRRLEFDPIILEFCHYSKVCYVDAKGKSTMASVKKWIRENKPSQFFASWKMDSPWHKDDSVKIYYRE